MRLRVVRFPVGGGRFENLATSLARAAHGPGELREIYALRWGIETAFRDLKHSVSLAKLHSAGFRGAAQEVYARMVLYNLCSAMAALAQLVVDARPRGGAQARARRELRGRRAGLPRGPVAARRARRRPPREDRGERLPGQAREELREAPQALVPGELRLPLLDSARRYGQCYHARRFRASAKLRARTCDPCLAKLA